MSPYGLCAAPEVLARLHPRLRAYFGAIPPGHVGRGEGVFTVVGTPRRWLHPLLAVFARDAVMFPVWAHDVPFTVENRPVRVGHGSGPRPAPATVDGMEARPASAPSASAGSGPGPAARHPSASSAAAPSAPASHPTRGAVAVRAHRTFRFPDGHRTMVDAIAAEPLPGGGFALVDHLGRRGRMSATLDIAVDAVGPDAGALRLVSTRVAFRALGREWSLPAGVAPQVRLEERFDDATDRQRVSLVLRAPFLGTLYRYEGSFTYRVAPEDENGRGGPAGTGTA